MHVYLYPFIMTLIKSISGIRGTIGGLPGDNLSPLDVVKFTSAFCAVHQEKFNQKDITIVMGRDARISGEMIATLAAQTIVGMGAHVIDLGLSTTPTVEMAVVHFQAQAGIILTASHNPAQWNALKLLNEKGEFISAEIGQKVLSWGEQGVAFAEVNDLGTITQKEAWDFHFDAILKMELVNKNAIADRKLKVVVDGINSSGSTFVPAILKALGVHDIIVLNEEANGRFAHNPEPLAEHLIETCARVKSEGADLGIVVDPDVDRLAFIDENGVLFGEEYTLVAIADYVLKHKKGNTVSNLSSTRALRDVTVKHGGEYFAAAVGEVNVVEKMKAVNAVIGGEGNGGIIVPELHYGRDAIVGIALFLSHFVEMNMTMSALKQTYPAYYMGKKKVDLDNSRPSDQILSALANKYKDENINLIDGVKIDFPDYWVHLRRSNTEPIIRIYTEASSQEMADQKAQDWIQEINDISLS
jgi:phosphomannomutase